MKLFIYSIYDTAAAGYMRPFFQQSDAQAVRIFSDLSIEAGHELAKHPEDYSLFRLAMFDDNDGKIESLHPECLITGLEAVAKSRQVNPQQLQAFDDEVSS